MKLRSVLEREREYLYLVDCYGKADHYWKLKLLEFKRQDCRNLGDSGNKYILSAYFS